MTLLGVNFGRERPWIGAVQMFRRWDPGGPPAQRVGCSSCPAVSVELCLAKNREAIVTGTSE